MKNTEKELHFEENHKAALMDTPPTEETVVDLADLFKLFGDSTRLKILLSLLPGEMNVCALSEALSMTVSAVSHQLKLLKQSKLIKARKEGKQVFYSLADDHVCLIIRQGLEHVLE